MLKNAILDAKIYEDFAKIWQNFDKILTILRDRGPKEPLPGSRAEGHEGKLLRGDRQQSASAHP